MTRRSTILEPRRHDGTSQRGRWLPALDPGYAVIDERGHAELLTFVREFVTRLRYFGEGQGPNGQADEPVDLGTWEHFATHPRASLPPSHPDHLSISIADMVAYMADPKRFEGEPKRWLGRPHFALLLTFLELFGRAREQLNGLTGKHLDYFFRDILRMRPRAAMADRVAVLATLAKGVDQARLPAGTPLDAGRDSSGAPRIYRTERELIANRAEIASLRSVYVHRRITGIPDVRRDRSLTAGQTLQRMLELALGDPQPGDAIQPWEGRDAENPDEVNPQFLVGLIEPLAFCRDHLFLEHHELRTLMRLVERRQGEKSDDEWAEINRLLGVDNPDEPRNFTKNLESVVGVLDFETDPLPQVNDIDDLYTFRHEEDVRAFIDQHLAPIGFEDFEKLMPIKLRIDAEWAEINRILERIGRRRLERLSWKLTGEDPTAFQANLEEALGEGEEGEQDKWPPVWPLDSGSITGYEAKIRSLESHLSMSAERLERLAAFAEKLGESSAAEEFDWSEIDRLLLASHRERVHAGRREKLAEVRGDADDLVGFDAVVNFALGTTDKPLAWKYSRTRLAEHLSRGQLELLDIFRRQYTEPAAPRPFVWADVYRVLELAQRSVEQVPEPVPLETQWYNLYAYEDARSVPGDPEAARWETFGAVPAGASKLEKPPAAAATLGWALRSPVLSLAEGTRTITLTLGFSPNGFDRDAFLRALGLQPEEVTEEDLRNALQKALIVELSSEKGWIALEIVKTVPPLAQAPFWLASAKLAPGTEEDDYWALIGVPRAIDEDRPALQLKLEVAPSVDPIAPLAGDGQSWPTLRVNLRQQWSDEETQWITRLKPFEHLVLGAVHCKVHVDGLASLQLQHEDRPLDPAKPFEPFGSRPAAGTRFYVSHPEFARARLDMIRFDIEWMGVPESLESRYKYYIPAVTGGGSFTAELSLVDRGLVVGMHNDPDLEGRPPIPLALFTDTTEDGTSKTAAEHELRIANVSAALENSQPGFQYERRVELNGGRDIRATGRYIRWELSPRDFGHSTYATLAAEKARQLAIDIAADTVAKTPGGEPDPDVYKVDPPYTPTIKSLTATYQTSIELEPTKPSPDDDLLHVHPFGVAPIDPGHPTFVPRYDQAGELYIGLRGLAPPQHLSLLLQLAEGTSAPDLERAPVSWWCLDGDRWHDLGDGSVRYDSTRGLINSGIVELALPSVTPSGCLPGELHWLRISIPRNTASVCDAVDIRAQAVLACFEDSDSAPDHYEQPLAVDSISRLVRPDARIASIDQPYTSFGGKPAEHPNAFYTRVSERLRHKHRALTSWDYERLVLDRFAGIYKTKCLSALGAGALACVEVIVIPDIRKALPSDTLAPKAPANLLADIQAYLAARAPADVEVHVRNPDYVPVRVRLGVRFRAGQDAGFATKRFNDDLIRFLSPWAYDEGAEVTIGSRIYATSILDFADRLEYVDYVAELKLFRGDGEGNVDLVPPEDVDYHVATDRPDQVLVSDPDHFIDVISELGYQQDSFRGIGYMRIELDFIVG